MGNTATQRRSKQRNVAKLAVAPIATLRETNRSNTSAGAATVDVNKPLTDKQKAFALAIGQGDTIPNAIVRAGFADASTTFGYRMAKMPNIQAAIARERDAFAKANELTRKKVFDMQLEAYEMAKLMSEPATMVAAAREIGRMAGFYEPVKKTIDININTGVMKDLSQASDTDLIEIIQKAEAAAREAAEAEVLALENEDNEDTVE